MILLLMVMMMVVMVVMVMVMVVMVLLVVVTVKFPAEISSLIEATRSLAVRGRRPMNSRHSPAFRFCQIIVTIIIINRVFIIIIIITILTLIKCNIVSNQLTVSVK